MVAGLFSECNVLREKLQDAVPAVLERDGLGVRLVHSSFAHMPFCETL